MCLKYETTYVFNCACTLVEGLRKAQIRVLNISNKYSFKEMTTYNMVYVNNTEVKPTLPYVVLYRNENFYKTLKLKLIINHVTCAMGKVRFL